MESPIRYLLHSATNAKNEDFIMDLGPIAYAIKSVVGNASPSRTDTAKNPKFWCFLGMPMLDAQISDIKEFEPTKKEPAGCIGLTGFNACYDRKKAQETAWEHVEKTTTPVIIQIEFGSEVNYFKLNKPEYTPYSQSEQLILLQDGVKLSVQSSKKEQIVVDKKKKTQY